MMSNWNAGLFADWALGSFYHATLPTGNGLCIVCITPSGHLIIYDCGSDGIVSPAKFVRKCIRDYHAGEVHHKADRLIISHPHVDHYKAIHEFHGDRREIPVRTLRRRKNVLTNAVSQTMREGRAGERAAARTLKDMSDEYIHPTESVSCSVVSSQP